MARYIFQGTWQTGNGTVVNDGTVTVYLANTTTLAIIYAAKTGGSAISGSQVTPSANGHFYFFVDTTDYGWDQEFKIILTRTNMESTTWDYIAIYPYRP